MANTYIYSISDTWNNANVEYDAFKININATASNANSYIVRFQYNGVDVLRYRKDNQFYINGQASTVVQTLTDAANVAWNCNSGARAKVTLGGNRNMDAVSNAVEGTSYLLCVIQDATGGRILTWTTTGTGSFDFGSEGAPTLSSAANTADILGFEALSIGGTLKLRYVGIKTGYT